MIDIRRKRVKAIYFNAFHCPECGLELHKDNIVLTTYPAQYCYYCDCGFRTTSFQQPGYEYEFEDDDDLSAAYPKVSDECFDLNDMIDKFNEIPLSFMHTGLPTVEKIDYVMNNNLTVSAEEAIENIKAVQQTLNTMMEKEQSYV